MNSPSPTPIKIACVALSEMGHFIPMSHIVDALIKRGHDVYFITNNDAYNGHKSSTIMTSINCKNQVFTDDGLVREEFFKKAKHIKNDNHQLRFFNEWRQLVKKELEKIMPDVVVCDFYSRVGCEAADQLKIPSVINCPGMIQMCNDWGFTGVIDIKNSQACCGQICVSQPVKQCLMKSYLKYVEPTNEYSFSWNKRVVLFNSFWGLDEAIAIPPNYTLTGPLSLPQGDLVQQLEAKDPELFSWLNEAHDKNQKVVYISLGSIAKWEDWSVQVMFEGLKKVGCRVIWSLKDKKLPKEDPDFWVKPWVPQVELLAHPAVQAGLTHCGFGGCLEFISAGVPIVAFPHFVDQPGNAVEMEKRKIAVILHNRGETMEADIQRLITYKEPVFDSQKVYEVFNEALTNPVYKTNIQKLQKLAQKSGGRDLAVQVIENVQQVGLSHLVDEAAAKQAEKLSCCCECWFKLFFVAMIAAMITFTVLYFVQEEAK